MDQTGHENQQQLPGGEVSPASLASSSTEDLQLRSSTSSNQEADTLLLSFCLKRENCVNGPERDSYVPRSGVRRGPTVITIWGKARSFQSPESNTKGARIELARKECQARYHSRGGDGGGETTAMNNISPGCEFAFMNLQSPVKIVEGPWVSRVGPGIPLHRPVTLLCDQSRSVNSVCVTKTTIQFLLGDGSLWSMGIGDHGELGLGESVLLARCPHKVGFGYSAVSSSDYHCLAIHEGTLVSWGHNKYNGFNEVENHQFTPKQLTQGGWEKMSGDMSIACGRGNSFVLRNSDQALFFWGMSIHQIGVGPTPTFLGRFEGPGSIQKMSIGKELGLFLTTDGRLFEYGSKDLAGAVTRTEKSPDDASDDEWCYNINNTPTPTDDRAVVVEAKAARWKFERSVPELFKGPMEDFYPRLIPAHKLLYHVPVKDIAAGNSHVVIVSANGQVLTWGRNTKGQVGISPAKSMQTSDAFVVPHVSGDAQWAFAGPEQSGIVDDRGRLYLWGNDEGYTLIDSALRTEIKVLLQSVMPNSSINNTDRPNPTQQNGSGGGSSVIDDERVRAGLLGVQMASVATATAEGKRLGESISEGIVTPSDCPLNVFAAQFIIDVAFTEDFTVIVGESLNL